MYFGVYFTIFSYKQSASIKALLKFQTNFKKLDKNTSLRNIVNFQVLSGKKELFIINIK